MACRSRRFYRTALATLLFFMLAAAAPAQTQPVLNNKYQGPYGHFSHWSALIPRDGGRFDAEYAVCNFDNSKALIFKWRGPNITLGDGGRLPSNMCAIVRREWGPFEVDRNAAISFTQAGRNHLAVAYVPTAVISAGVSNALPRSLANQIRTFFGPENVEPSFAALTINSIHEDEALRHIISWHPPSVTVVIPSTAFGGVPVEYAASEVRSRGYTAAATSLKEALAESSRDLLPAERLDQRVVTIQRPEQAPLTLDFTVKLGERLEKMAGSHVTLIDTATKRLIADFPISSFSP